MLLLAGVFLMGFLHFSCSICPGCNVLKMESTHRATDKRYIQWDDIFNLTLSPKYASIHWTNEGHLAWEANTDGYYKIDAKTHEKVKRFFSAEELFGMDFELSADEQFALMYIYTKSKFRHSFYADYILVDLSLPVGDRRRHNVTLDPTGTNNVQYAGWSPTGHTLVVVADLNLFTTKDPMSKSYTQHTFDGLDNIIFNGVPDWVYEEEVVQNYYSNYPSPDSRFVVFTRTNATGVRHVRFPVYGHEDYATLLDYEYPKAGYKNPTIGTYVVDLEDDNSAAYLLPTPEEVLAWGEHYLYTVSWANDDTVVCEWWNRGQTKIVFYQCSVSRDDPSCTKIFNEDSQGGWMDWWKHPLWYFDGLDRFATLLPSYQGVEGNFKHICLFSKQEDGAWSRKFVTSGTYDVLSIYAQLQQDDKQYLFYEASKGGQMYRHVYKLDLADGRSECLSCDGYCGYATASFSADATMYRLTCYGPVTPYVQIKEVDSVWSKVLESNNDLDQLLRTFELPKREYLTENIGGFDINVQRVSPPDFDENSTRRYPALVYVYGGPDSQMVKDLYPFGEQRKDFHNFLANGDPEKPQFIVYYIDVRGTVGRGDDFRFPLYRKFGITEVDDTLDFLAKLRQYHYIDDARIAIWGWSYGGFLSAKVASSGAGLVQAAISVAPVTSYHFYDTIYTERYMGLPQATDEYPEGNPNYEHGDVLHEAANMKNTNFFLIHGSADDNVHYTNTARLAYELVEHDVDFRMHVYTDKAHSLKGSVTRHHLYRMLREYLYSVLDLNGDYLNYYRVAK